MRTIAPSALTALTNGRCAEVLLVEMQLSSTVYLCSAGCNIDWNGHTWTGTSTLGAVAPVADTADELQGLQFALAAALPEMVGLALGEATQGKKVIVRCMVLDVDTHAVVDVQTVWTGTLEPLVYEESFNETGITAPQIGVTAEHRGMAMQRARPLRYTDADQQLRFPGDTSLRFIVAQANHQDIWPAASFFKQ